MPLEQLAAAFDAEVEPTAEIGMCSLPERHSALHTAHPSTGRMTCVRCYPPALEATR
jgi:hypothetical protein